MPDEESRRLDGGRVGRGAEGRLGRGESAKVARKEGLGRRETGWLRQRCVSVREAADEDVIF